MDKETLQPWLRGSILYQNSRTASNSHKTYGLSLHTAQRERCPPHHARGNGTVPKPFANQFLSRITKEENFMPSHKNHGTSVWNPAVFKIYCVALGSSLDLTGS